MSRIDVQTLVLAFEKRIEALEKNPPDKIPTAVILKMLEKSIDEIIKDHFLFLIMKEIKKVITTELEEMHKNFIKSTINNMLSDEKYMKKIEDTLKNKIIESIKL